MRVSTHTHRRVAGHAHVWGAVHGGVVHHPRSIVAGRRRRGVNVRSGTELLPLEAWRGEARERRRWVVDTTEL